jgi:hypothetical protein
VRGQVQETVLLQPALLRQPYKVLLAGVAAEQDVGLTEQPADGLDLTASARQGRKVGAALAAVQGSGHVAL